MRLITLYDSLPVTKNTEPSLLDDEVPIMTSKKVYELMQYLTGKGEFPELLFRVNGDLFKGRVGVEE